MLPNSNLLPLPTIFRLPLPPQADANSRSEKLVTTDQAVVNTASTAGANSASSGATPLRQMHANMHTSSPALPNTSCLEKEKKQNLQRLELFKELGRIEAKINKLQRELKKVRTKNEPEESAALRKTLRQLKDQKNKLITEISSEGSTNSSSKSISAEDPTDSSGSDESIEVQLHKVKKDIKNCKESLAYAERDGKEKQAFRLEQKLQDLRSQRDRLKSQSSLSQPDGSSVGHSSELNLLDYKEVLRDLDECKESLRQADKQGKEQEVRSLMREIRELENERETLRLKIEEASTRDSSTSGSDSPAPASTNPIIDVKQQLEGRRAKIAELDRILAKLNSQGAKKESIQEYLTEKTALETEAGYLESLLRVFESQENTDAGEETVASNSTAPAPPARAASMSRMLHTAATKRRRSSMPTSQAVAATVDGTTPLKALYDKTRNSTLLMSGDLKKHFSEMALQEIEELDLQIEKLANDVDLLYEIRRRQIEAGNPPGNRKARAKWHQEMKSLYKSILKGNIRLGKLIEEKEKLEARVIPPEQILTPKQQAEQYKSFIDRFKSAKTRKLDQEHTDRLAELEHRHARCCGTFGLQLLGGWAANATSFFIGNSIARAITPSFAGAIVSVPVSALLHVMVSGPLLKQVLDRMWNAPALAEFNNYFKLLGASWGDWARGEENKKKYVSKNPEQKEKLTIAERRAEQRPFKKLLRDRYKTEEAGYYVYTMNYGFKALAAAGLTAAGMSSLSDTYRWSEWAAHSVMGWISGAEYVVAMQEARSTIPGAKQTVLPDRATSAAEAEALQSLLDDLQKGLQKSRDREEKDPADRTERELLKAIRKTQKALQAARTRSGFLGTFRHEFKAQFANKEATADTLSESAGRAISLIPTALLAEYMKHWRSSGNFWEVSGIHALQGLLLILPPGFTARPLYCGLLRASIQAVINGKDRSADGNAQPSSSGKAPGGEDQGEESIIVEVSSDSDDEGWHGNPRESDQDFW